MTQPTVQTPAPVNRPPVRPGTASSGPPGSDLQTGAQRIAGLLDDNLNIRNTPGVSRAHPDYDPNTDPRNNMPDRDRKGRFTAAPDAEPENRRPARTDDPSDAATGDTHPEDTAPDTDGDTNDARATAADDASTDAPDTSTIQTLAQLATELDIPLEELKAKITHKFRAADQDVEVTLAELEKGYQKDADYRRATGKLADDRRAAEADYTIRMQQFEQQNVYLANHLNLSEQMLTAELNDPRLQRLRESDPAEWTARRAEIGQRLGALQQAREMAAQNYQRFVYQQKETLVAREMQALQAKIPGFGAEHKDKAQKTLLSIGLTAAEIGDVFDHRLVTAAVELHDLRAEVAKLRAKQDAAAKTVTRVTKDIPKLVSPGKSQVAQGAQVRRDNITKLRDKARKTGRLDDAARALEHLL